MCIVLQMSAPCGGIFGPPVEQPKKGTAATRVDVKITSEVKQKREEIAKIEEELKKTGERLATARLELDALESKDPMYHLRNASYTDVAFKTSKLTLSQLVAIPLPERLKHLPDFTKETEADLNLNAWQKSNLAHYLATDDSESLFWE